MSMEKKKWNSMGWKKNSNQFPNSRYYEQKTSAKK